MDQIMSGELHIRHQKSFALTLGIPEVNCWASHSTFVNLGTLPSKVGNSIHKSSSLTHHQSTRTTYIHSDGYFK